MNNFREINDDILKDWLFFRQEKLFSLVSEEDKKHWVYYEDFAEKILENVSSENKKAVKKQLENMQEHFLDYTNYWNEKYYRNGFVDGVQLVSGCLKTLS